MVAETEMGRTHLVSVALAVLLAPGATAQQQTAVVDGIVVRMGTAEPLPGARVEIMREMDPRGGPARPVPEGDRFFEKTVTTGADGRFSIDGISPGLYRLYATRSGGYVPGEFGQRSPTGRGTAFEVTAGQRVSGVQLALTPTGSIAGRVYDADGEPLPRALVQALKPVYRDGRRTLTIAQAVPTNDRGEYRLFWLAPGSYYVAVRPAVEDGPISGIRIIDPSRVATFELASGPVLRNRSAPGGEIVEEVQPVVYFPGAADLAGAARIDLRAGGAADGVDVRALPPVRTWHVRGIAIDRANGQPMAGVVSAVPVSDEPYLAVPSNRSSASGAFDIAGVTPGPYLIVASSRGGATGIVSVQVGDADVDNITIPVSSGFRLTGRISIEGPVQNDRQPFGRLELRRDPDIVGLQSGGPSFTPPPAADGSFTADGIQVGDFRATLGFLPKEAYIKSMRLGNVDVLDAGLHVNGPFQYPLEIVIGPEGGRLSGSVANSRGEPLVNATVVLVPEAPRRRRADLYKAVSSDGGGRFQLQGLTPGDYKIFAWDDVEDGAWLDPEFIRAFENRGTRARIDEGRDAAVRLVVP